MATQRHAETSRQLRAGVVDGRGSADGSRLAVQPAMAMLRELVERDPSLYGRDLTTALSQWGGTLFREGHSDEALEVFVEAARIALQLNEEVPPQFHADVVQRLINVARAFMADREYAHAWEAARSALELELSREQPTWLEQLDERLALLRELFAAFIAEKKFDQAAETIPLSKQLRQRQAVLLAPNELDTVLGDLIRDARLLHSSLRDLEAWPLLQEAIAMRPMLRVPALDRTTMSLASQLIESAIVFHCSNRRAMAMEATEIAAALYRELMQRRSGYYASQLRTMLEKMPANLRQVALGIGQELFDEQLEQDTSEERQAEAGPGRRPRILVVDDSALMLDLAKEALEGAGYDVDIAQVLSQIADEDKLRTFDLILLDVMMPELHGDDVAMILRNELTGITASIYLLSSLAKEELAKRARDAGIEGYISKRDGIEALVERVHEILSERTR
ncbi:MAG: response regulator [Proteobacteria bacterium]|nr:response regulator [Pseudomonadota bacterium]